MAEANNTQKEKALKEIAKQIKGLDKNALLFQDAKVDFFTSEARAKLFNIIQNSGFSLEAGTYKLVKNKEFPFS